jgi:hydrogenase nickel incorporation protein HypB
MLTVNQTIKVYKEILSESNRRADETRSLLNQKKIKMINIIGSPGCGKTSLIEAMSAKIGNNTRFAVLEGDVETIRDAERLAARNIKVSQIITGGGCHLQAKMVYEAITGFDLDALDFVIVENVGNLVCPAEFDIGEHAKVAVLSVTEGEDKPLKYPLLFREAKCCLITKTDLLPHLDYDIGKCENFIREVNSGVPIIRVSSKSSEGIDIFIDWLRHLGTS